MTEALIYLGRSFGGEPPRGQIFYIGDNPTNNTLQIPEFHQGAALVIRHLYGPDGAVKVTCNSIPQANTEILRGQNFKVSVDNKSLEIRHQP